MNLGSGSSGSLDIKCSVECPKCGHKLVPVYLDEDVPDFLLGGWCPKCRKHYPLVPADIDTAYELYGG